MEHEIVMDLLPLYHDGVCSEASRATPSFSASTRMLRNFRMSKVLPLSVNRHCR